VFKRASDFNSLGYYKTNNRVVKGGSWADSPQYLITGSREVYNETESSCKVGFRIAMNAPSNLDFLSFREKKRLKKK
jgi:formylglycine-generating enzyme required for sulfatase activity